MTSLRRSINQNYHNTLVHRQTNTIVVMIGTASAVEGTVWMQHPEVLPTHWLEGGPSCPPHSSAVALLLAC